MKGHRIVGTIWTGRTGRLIRRLPEYSKDVRLLQLYLCTGPSAVLWGLYNISPDQITVDTGLTSLEITTGFQVLREVDFAYYDAETSCVWVVEMAAQQLVLPLKATDYMVPAANRWYRALPSNPFLRPFYRRYRDDLGLEVERTPAGRGAGVNGEPVVVPPVAAVGPRVTVISELEGWFTDRFWPAYPRHTHRQQALRAIQTLNPGPELRAVILAALEQQKATVWADVDETVIPHVATWIAGARWTDEVATSAPVSRRTAAVRRAVDDFIRGKE